MKAKLRSLLLLLGLASFPLLAADNAGTWSSDFEESFTSGEPRAFGSYRPAPLALSIARQIGEAEFGELAPQEAAGLALKLAISANADIRGGLTYQEAKARSMQQARLLMKDRDKGRNAGVEGLQRMRSRSELEHGRAQSGNLAEPLRMGPATVDHGRMRSK